MWNDSDEDEEEKTKDETCLAAQASNEICLGINWEPNEWIKDSGCSKHMTCTTHLGLWYPKGSGIETLVYADSDHHTALAISTTEAEYVSVEKTCQQALWMKQALVDSGISLDDILIMFDNKGSIDLSKNPVQHSRTKHIEICHHFLRDNVQKGNISIEKFSSEDNIDDI
ncbi:hypothetical protein Tco_1249241 [Tanacetum coccineum]